MNKLSIAFLGFALLGTNCFSQAEDRTTGTQPAKTGTLQTKDATFKIDNKGFITSIVSRKSKKEYSPKGHPSPLMSLSFWPRGCLTRRLTENG